MSWNNYNQGQGTYGAPGSAPYGTPQGAPSQPYGQPTSQPYGAPTSQPYAQPYGVPVYSYSPQNPPRPRVGFVQAGKLFFKNYAVFHGRASQSEYWWIALWGVIASVVFSLVFAALIIPIASSSSSSASSAGMGVMSILISLLGVLYLGILVPSLALQVRRLHDAGFSGFFVLLSLTYIGAFVVLAMCIMGSKPEGVRYDNPDGSQPAVA